MNELLIQIRIFFRRESFSMKELDKLYNRIKNDCKKEEVSSLQDKLKKELKSYNKFGKVYKRKKRKVLESTPKISDNDLVNEFLSKNTNINNAELAKKLKIDFVLFRKISKKYNILELKKDGFLSNTEGLLLFDFLESSLNAINRKKIAIKNKKA